MQRIRKPKVVASVNSKDQKTKLIVAGIILAIVVFIVFVLIFIESSGGKLTVKNKTDLNLEYVKAYFVYEDGALNDELLFEDINPNENLNSVIDEIDLTGLEANLEVRFKFEDYDEMFVDAGIFNAKFDGNIKIAFEDAKDDNLVLKVKASNGILPSDTIDCNEEFIIFLSEGYVE